MNNCIVNKHSNQNSMLNFLKCLACIGVVLIHVKFPGDFGVIVAKTATFAVPLFFMIAGYYSFGCNEEKIKKRTKKILFIFLYGVAFFFAYFALAHILTGDLSQWASKHLNIKSLVNLIVFCTVDFAVPLWYLIAMAETYIFWQWVIKCHRQNSVIKWLVPLFLLQITVITLCDTVGLPWQWKTNFVTRALPWFVFGYYLHKNETAVTSKFSNGKLVIIAAVGCMLTITPLVAGLQFDFSSAGIVLYAVAIFIIGVKNPHASLCRPMEYIGEKLSLNVYIFHYLISGAIASVFRHLLGINVDGGLYLCVHPFITIAASIVFSYIVNILSTLLSAGKQQQ